MHFNFASLKPAALAALAATAARNIAERATSSHIGNGPTSTPTIIITITIIIANLWKSICMQNRKVITWIALYVCIYFRSLLHSPVNCLLNKFFFRLFLFLFRSLFYRFCVCAFVRSFASVRCVRALFFPRISNFYAPGVRAFAGDANEGQQIHVSWT